MSFRTKIDQNGVQISFAKAKFAPAGKNTSELVRADYLIMRALDTGFFDHSVLLFSPWRSDFHSQKPILAETKVLILH